MSASFGSRTPINLSTRSAETSALEGDLTGAEINVQEGGRTTIMSTNGSTPEWDTEGPSDQLHPLYFVGLVALLLLLLALVPTLILCILHRLYNKSKQLQSPKIQS